MASRKGSLLVNNNIKGRSKRSKKKGFKRDQIKPDMCGSKRVRLKNDQKINKESDIITSMFTVVSSPVFQDEDIHFSECADKELMGKFCPAIRLVYEWMNTNSVDLDIDVENLTDEEIEKKQESQEKAVRKSIKSLVKDKYGLDDTETEEVVKGAIARRKSRKELVEGMYIPNCEERIKHLSQNILELEQKITSLKEKAEKTSGDKIRSRISRKEDILKGLILKNKKETKKLHKWQNELSSGRFSLCFGTAELLRNANKKLELSKNKKYPESQRKKFATESLELFDQWRLERDSEYKIGGSKTYNSGNQKFTLNSLDEGFQALIAVPEGRRENYHHDNYGRVACNKLFDFGKAVNPYVELAVRTYQHFDRSDKRKGTKHPVTFLLKKGYANKTIIDSNGNKKVVSSLCYRLHLTFHVEFILLSDKSKGAIGIDINAGSIDIAYINGQGQYIGKKTIRLNLHGNRANKNKDQVSKILEQIVKDAKYLGLPIVKEDLRFSRSGNIDKSKKFRRMAGSLNASQIDVLLSSKCSKNGIELIKVKPHYTSFIGMWKYMAMYGVNSGVAAGIVIARRGLGFVEKLPKAIIDKSGELPLDGCFSAKDFWGFLSSKFNQRGAGRHIFYQPSKEMLAANCWIKFDEWNKAIKKKRSSEGLTK